MLIYIMRTSLRLSKDLEQRLFDLTLALYRVTDFFPPGEILRKHLREKANEIFSQTLEYNYDSDAAASALKILGRIESVKGYQEIAKSLHIVRPINFVVLEREYIFLADFFVKELEFFNQAVKSSKPVITANPEMKEEKVTEKKEKKLLGPAVELQQPATVVASGGQPELHRSVNWQEFSGADSHSPLLLNERQEAILEHLKQAQQAKVSDFYSFFNNISSKTIQRDLQDLVTKNLLKREGEKRWTVYHLGASVQ